MPAPEPLQIGQYRLLCHLATGGMAEVWIAQGPNSRNDPLVCVKLMLAGLERDEEFLSMFIEEAKLAAPLQHPNLVQIDDLGVGDGRLYLAMEYIRGHALSVLAKALPERGERLAPELAAAMVAQVARGLDYAHDFRSRDGRSLGLVHRDISPHNLILRGDGRVKVVDFGIAKATSIAGTRTRGLKGKVGYMSPEQIHGRGIDRRTDVFALGVTLWELSTGQRLFTGTSEAEVLTKIMTQLIPDPRERDPDLPEELAALTLRALARKPENRLATAGELAEGLEAFVRARLDGPAEPILADLAARALPALPRTAEEALERARLSPKVPSGSLLAAAGDVSAASKQSLDPTKARPVTASDPRKTRAGRRNTGGEARETQLSGTLSPEDLDDGEPTAAAPDPSVTPRVEAPRVALTPEPAELLTEPPDVPEPGGQPGRSRLLLGIAGALVGLALTFGVYVGAGGMGPDPAVGPNLTPLPAPAEPRNPKAPPEAPAAPARDGFLTLRTDPWAEVSLGGRRLGNTPLVKVALPAGKQRLRLVNPKEGAFSLTVEVRPDETLDPGMVVLEDLAREP